MSGLGSDVRAGLSKHGIGGLPVIDLKIAEALAGIGLTHSKRTCPVHPNKEIVGF